MWLGTLRYFFQTCGSDINSGTHYHEAEACMRNYVQSSGYNAWAYIVGPHAIDAPAGSTKSVNNLVDYTGRASGNMFDSIEMTAVPSDGTQYPSESNFIITGPGFNFVQKTMVEDLFVVLPMANGTTAQ